MVQRRQKFAAAVVGVVALGSGCRAMDAQRPAARPSGMSSTAPAAPAAPPHQPYMTAQTRGTAPACSFVTLGFDRRALPTNTTPQGHQFWLVGETDKLRRVAPMGAAPRMYIDADASCVHALFDGTTAADVLARCTQTITAYLQTAPKLPLIGMGSAVQVVIACRSCD